MAGMSRRPSVLRRRGRRAARGAGAAALALALGGCASGSPPGRPAAHAVPLVARTAIVAQARVCDRGSHSYCAREFVLASPHHLLDAGVLKVAERTLLHNSGWRRTEGQTYDEFAADSPGDRLRITYATAEQDLLAIDERRIDRPPRIVRALAETLFAREPAISVIVQAGSG